MIETEHTGGEVKVELLDGHNVIAQGSGSSCKLTVTVEGGELLAFGAANPCTTEQYHTGSFTTYLGRSLAVVRVHEDTTIRVSDGVQSSCEHISVNKM